MCNVSVLLEALKEIHDLPSVRGDEASSIASHALARYSVLVSAETLPTNPERPSVVIEGIYRDWSMGDRKVVGSIGNYLKWRLKQLRKEGR